MNTSYVNDLPVKDISQDKLNFSVYCDTLYKLIQSDSRNTPLTIGIFGSWGAGKTSLMQMIQHRIRETEETKDYLQVWFDAWKYDKEEQLWRALLLQVLVEIREVVTKDPDVKPEDIQEIEDLAAGLYRSIEREELGDLKIDWHQLLKGSLETAIHVGVALVPGLNIVQKVMEDVGSKSIKDDPGLLLGAIERAKTKVYIDHVQSLEQFQNKFQYLVKNYVHKRGKLVVFIDDLDRCLPEKTISILESLKLFLDVEDCIFILGVDPDVITRAVELKYRSFGSNAADEHTRHQMLINGVRYLEKIIQVPFHLPSIEHEQVKTFVETLIEEQNWPNVECTNVFAIGLGDNPRQVKRAINTFLLLWELAQQKTAAVKPVQLAKLVVIQNIYPDLYFVLKQNPRLLYEIEKYYATPKSLGLRNEADTQASDHAAAFVPPELMAYANDAVLTRLFTAHKDNEDGLKFSDIKPDDLRSYFTLVGRADSPNIPPAGMKSKYFEPQVVAVGEENIRIGKYPITNIEYQAFVQNKPYHSPWGKLEYPHDKGDHPVVFVSWDDAKAYCDWLSEQTGKVYRLPTVEEWNRAAKGPDNHKYPWGDEWNPKNANTKELDKNNTTPVGQFSPQGDSYWGCSDMLGNVWEWIGNWSNENEKKYRILKGCAFDIPGKQDVGKEMNWDKPESKYDNVGFRVVLEIPQQ